MSCEQETAHENPRRISDSADDEKLRLEDVPWDLPDFAASGSFDQNWILDLKLRCQ